MASLSFIAQLQTIEPSDTGPWSANQRHYPCSLLLTDGTTIERAICVEDHRGFRGDYWIHPDDVASIKKSPQRMPAQLASKLYVAGESGMGYEIFKMKMRSGEEFVFVTGNVVDFPDLPSGFTSADIADVLPHQGREESKKGYRGRASFRWCFYVSK